MNRSLKSENPVAAGFTQNEKTNKKLPNCLLILHTEQPLSPQWGGAGHWHPALGNSESMVRMTIYPAGGRRAER